MINNELFIEDAVYDRLNRIPPLSKIEDAQQAQHDKKNLKKCISCYTFFDSKFNPLFIQANKSRCL